MSSDNVKVEYRQLGKSGLRVSVPVVGAMSFGSRDWMPWVIEEEDAIEVLKAAWDLGINTIDTANTYSNGISEKIIAKFIQKYSIRRERIIIATKCFFLSPEEDPKLRGFEDPHLLEMRDSINQYGLSRAAIFNQVEASLRRLDTNYIDLLQIHRFDYNTSVEETMKALHDLVESRKIRYIGASSMYCWQFATMNHVAEKNGWTKFISMQDEYSLQYREDERELHSYCNYNGIGLIPWGPLNGGRLARPNGSSTTRVQTTVGTSMERPMSETDNAIIDRVEEVAKKRGWTMAQVALAWVGTKVTSPIVGLSSVKRVKESFVSRGAFELTADEMKYLEEPYSPVDVRGNL